MVQAKMSVRRSDDFWLVAYFLSRCGPPMEGRAKTLPPRQLRAGSWKDAYLMFYQSLHKGRSITAFHNSMKHAREDFDGHLNSGRIGWRVDGPARSPKPLESAPREIKSLWQDRSDEELWEQVRKFVCREPLG